MTYLFAAYSAIWCILFFYLWTLKSRVKDLETRIEGVIHHKATKH